MFKLLFIFLIVYYGYKVMFKPEGIEGPQNNGNLNSKKENDNDDFVDYEEVE